MIDKRFRCQHTYKSESGRHFHCNRQGELCRVSVFGEMSWAKLLCAKCQERCKALGWNVEAVDAKAKVAGGA